MLEEEQRLPRTDTLTGLANSRAFSDALHGAIARNRRGPHAAGYWTTRIATSVFFCSDPAAVVSSIT